MKILNKTLYFFLVVVILQAIGIIIPVGVSTIRTGDFTNLPLNVVSFNMITYSASIFLASLVKRILVFVDDEKYKHKKLEILLLVILLLIQTSIFFGAYFYIYQESFDAAIKFSIITVLLSWIMWWVASQQDNITDPYSAIGGKI